MTDQRNDSTQAYLVNHWVDWQEYEWGNITYRSICSSKAVQSLKIPPQHGRMTHEACGWFQAAQLVGHSPWIIETVEEWQAWERQDLWPSSQHGIELCSQEDEERGWLNVGLGLIQRFSELTESHGEAWLLCYRKVFSRSEWLKPACPSSLHGVKASKRWG